MANPNPTFSCSNCGASLEYSGSGQTMICSYCQSTVSVPEEIWKPVEESKMANRWVKYLVIFLIITVGFPTCLGLLGTFLGVIGSILGTIIAIGAGILTFFVHK